MSKNKTVIFSLRVNESLKNELSYIDNKTIIDALKECVNNVSTKFKICIKCDNKFEIQCFDGDTCLNCSKLSTKKNTFKNLLYTDDEIISFYQQVESLRAKRKNDKSLISVKGFIKSKFDYGNYLSRIKVLKAQGKIKS